jgi:hypothetical protein
MLSKEDFLLVELLGKDTPQVQALVAAANAGMEVHEMLRSLARQKGFNPDDPPKFSLPHDISPSDYIIGTAMSGDVVGGDVGPSDADLHSHIGVFGMTSVGKSTAVKLLINAFMKTKTAAAQNRTFFVLDIHGEYKDMLLSHNSTIWLTTDDLGINPFEVPFGANGKRVMSPEKWVNNIREWLRMFWLNEPSINLLCEILMDEYEQRGILKGNENE